MNEADPVRQLAEGASVSLASWLADPLDGDQAQRLLEGVRQRMHAGRTDDAERFSLRLAELIGCYWAGDDIESAYQTMSALPGDAYRHALLELCRGQLFMARRRLPAQQHLDRGFQLAAHLLEAEDYFLVLRRHELLRQLPLAATPGDAATLEALLREAQVIARLKGPGRHHEPGNGKHLDTIG